MPRNSLVESVDIPSHARKCSSCSLVKALDEFEKRKDRPHGRGYRCKQCCVKRTSGWQTQPEVWARQLDDRRARYHKAPEKYRARRRELAHQKRYPKGSLQHRAHVAVSWAIRSGKLTRPSACQLCGATGKIHAHHFDYSKSLDVHWLCVPCHGKQHRRSYLPPETP